MHECLSTNVAAADLVDADARSLGGAGGANGACARFVLAAAVGAAVLLLAVGFGLPMFWLAVVWSSAPVVLLAGSAAALAMFVALVVERRAWVHVLGYLLAAAGVALAATAVQWSLFLSAN